MKRQNIDTMIKIYDYEWQKGERKQNNVTVITYPMAGSHMPRVARPMLKTAESANCRTDSTKVSQLPILNMFSICLCTLLANGKESSDFCCWLMANVQSGHQP